MVSMGFMDVPFQQKTSEVMGARTSPGGHVLTYAATARIRRGGKIPLVHWAARKYSWSRNMDKHTFVLNGGLVIASTGFTYLVSEGFALAFVYTASSE